jgi:hypothetical protein
VNGSKLLFWPHFRTQNRSTLLLEMLQTSGHSDERALPLQLGFLAACVQRQVSPLGCNML